MNKYIGTKLVEAKEINLGDYNKFKGWTIPDNEDPKTEGYMVKYSDDYISWCPKEQFEMNNLKVDENKDLPSGVSIGPQMVQDFIADYDIFTKKDKITIVIATLKNGFTIVESSACVDPKNYNEEIGAEICKERIKNQVWNHLGFLLQTAFKGIK